jgi:hypothetical protein
MGILNSKIKILGMPITDKEAFFLNKKLTEEQSLYPHCNVQVLGVKNNNGEIEIEFIRTPRPQKGTVDKIDSLIESEKKKLKYHRRGR